MSSKGVMDISCVFCKVSKRIAFSFSFHYNILPTSIRSGEIKIDAINPEISTILLLDYNCFIKLINRQWGEKISNYTCNE